ncbi:MAG TPA: hypothetical protein VGU74_09525 [Gemmatimonadales bacterium]|nr:hypothetical protein [Gemmatimonadales bacterium]
MTSQLPRPSSQGGRGLLFAGGVAAVAFFLSGAAALVYEATWSRYLGLFLGHAAYAQAIVLVTFLGGMAIGAIVAGRRSEGLRRPWLWYAAVELAVGGLGFVFHPVYVAVTGWAYDRLLPALPEGAPLVLIRWVLAAALILPQSVLLGATFPLLAVGMMRRRPDTPGRILAFLYFVNGIGGAVGVLVGGFALVPAVGLPGALVAAAIGNVVAAVLVGGAELLTSETAGAPAAAMRSAGPHAAIPRRMLVGVAFGTAVASLVYEIAWTRMLSLVLGSATHSFELMLSAFLVGLSLGALWVRRRADRFRDPLRTLGVIQWVMGGLAVATLPLYVASFRWSAALFAALDVTPQGYVLFTIARYGLCLIVMLPATFCAGMTLPLITQILVRSGDGESAVGRVYGVNTLGSIFGVAFGALILLPLVGIKALLFAGAVLDMALGVWLLAVPRARQFLLAATTTSVVWLAGVAWLARFDRNVLTSGVYRARRLATPGSQRIVFYKDGVTATVAAAIQQAGTVVISTNGKADASLDDAWFNHPPPGAPRRILRSDAATQTLLALVTLAHAPAARTAAVIGHGSGMSAHLLLGDPRLTSVTTIEIERTMILGSNAFYPANRRVFDDPRSHFVIEDARAYLAAGRRRYDVILSEPSNPWVSGVSGLFTTEFYDEVSRHLTDDGVFGQWLHLYEMNDDLLLTVLAALHQRFASYALFYTANLDILVVASRRPALPVPDWSVVQQPGIAEDLAGFIPLTPETLERLRFADRATFAPLLDAGIRPNSDYFPVLDLGAERARYLGQTANGFTGLAASRFDPFAALAGRRAPLPLEPVTAVPEIAPAYRTALAGRLRLHRDGSHDALPPDADYDAALLRDRMMTTFLAAGAPPPDWQPWMRSLSLVEQDVHGTAQGTADEGFYAALERYVARNRLPLQARAAVDFLHGLAAWDFPRAAAAADRLLLDATLGEAWVPRDMYREGAVVAKLKIGDVVGARRLFNAVVQLPGGRSGLRTRLLEAHLRAAEAAAAPAAPAR